MALVQLSTAIHKPLFPIIHNNYLYFHTSQ